MNTLGRKLSYTMKLRHIFPIAIGLVAGGLHAGILTVINTNDSLAGSLRQAIQDAASGDKIVFNIPTGDPGYDPASRTFTIRLVQPSPSDPTAALVISKNLTIDGTGSRIVVKRTNGSSAPYYRVFSITTGTVTLARITVSGGNAHGTTSGDAIRNAGTLTIDRCAIVGNGGTGNGIGYLGAVANTGSLLVVNSTIASNSSNLDAAVFNAAGGALTLRSCTITNNSGIGVGVPAGVENSGTAHVGNCVIAQNTGGGRADAVGAYISDGYNFIGDFNGQTGSDSTGFGGPGSHDQLGTYNAPADPRLGPLQDNGGVTQTMSPLPGSPVIDQGNSFGLTVDQRDRRRPIDNSGIANAGDSADIGAIETDVPQVGPTFTVNTTDEHSDQFCGVQDCSLWDAANASAGYIANTGQAATVKFASNVRGTITTALQADGIEIGSAVNITGPGASALTISGAGVSRVFHILPGATNVKISNLKIANGSISDYGGGILNEGGLSLSSCILSNNNAPGFSGGGLFNAGTVSLTDITVSANSAYSGGGISNSGTCTLTNVTLSGNSATNGGGIFSTISGTTNITNVTVSGNAATNFGGGISNTGTANVTNVTLSGNSATNGGGIYNNGTITLKNTLIAKGTSGANCGGFSGGSFNLSDDNACGFTTAGDPLQRDNVSDLKLGPLASNGGFTQTHLPQTGSRAIDHGTVVAGLNTDQRGVKRPQGLAFDVGAVEAGVTLIEDKSYFIQYDGWSGVKNASANGGTYRISKTANDTITYKFTNTSIKWITAKGPNMGQALVTIDGTSAGTIDLYSPSVLWKQQIPFSGLTNAAHTIVIKVTGTKNASATDFNVAVDGFLVGSGTTAVQESAVAVTYNTWTGNSQSAASGGSYRSNGTLGSVARFKFTGTAVTLLTARGPGYGMVNVLIDGVTKSSNFDLYAISAQWKYGVSYSGLTNATHTIEIRPTHTKNSSSTGYNVVLDAFTGPFTAVP